MTIAIWILTAALGVAGATYGAAAGGAGILIVPVLIALGNSVRDSIIAFEVGALGMMCVASYRFHRSNMIDYSLALPIAATSMVGSAIGAYLLVTSTAPTVERLAGIAFLLLCPVIIWTARRQQSAETASSLPARLRLTVLAFFFVGLWSGFFSAGAHILATLLLVLVARKTFLESAALTKIEGLGSGLLSTAVFAATNSIPPGLTSALIVGMSIGGSLGSGLGIRKGEVWVRRIFIAVMLATGVRLLCG